MLECWNLNLFISYAMLMIEGKEKAETATNRDLTQQGREFEQRRLRKTTFLVPSLLLYAGQALEFNMFLCLQLCE